MDRHLCYERIYKNAFRVFYEFCAKEGNELFTYPAYKALQKMRRIQSSLTKRYGILQKEYYIEGWEEEVKEEFRNEN